MVKSRKFVLRCHRQLKVAVGAGPDAELRQSSLAVFRLIEREVSVDGSRWTSMEQAPPPLPVKTSARSIAPRADSEDEGKRMKVERGDDEGVGCGMRDGGALALRLGAQSEVAHRSYRSHGAQRSHALPRVARRGVAPAPHFSLLTSHFSLLTSHFSPSLAPRQSPSPSAPPRAASSRQYGR